MRLQNKVWQQEVQSQCLLKNSMPCAIRHGLALPCQAKPQAAVAGGTCRALSMPSSCCTSFRPPSACPNVTYSARERTSPSHTAVSVPVPAVAVKGRAFCPAASARCKAGCSSRMRHAPSARDCLCYQTTAPLLHGGVPACSAGQGSFTSPETASALAQTCGKSAMRCIQTRPQRRC